MTNSLQWLPAGRLHSWSRSGQLAIAIMCLLVLRASAGLVAPPLVVSATTEQISVGAWDSPALTPLDPETLADEIDAIALVVDPASAWALSTDGAMFAHWDTSDGTIIVQRMLDSDPPVRVEPPARLELCCFGVSRDGTRVVTLVRNETDSVEGVQPRVWAIIATRTGNLWPEVRTDGGAWEQVIVDPDRARLYRLWVEGDLRDPRPRPVELTVYDLVKGNEVGHVQVPQVIVHIQFDGVNLDNHLPGVALSPDGRHLAFIHAASDRITVVDTTSLAVERTVQVTIPPSLGERVLQTLGLAPAAASAKMMTGRVNAAVFASDGRHLYTFGSENEPGANPSEVIEHGLGLRLIDLDTGVIVAQALPDELLVQVLLAFDGTALYTVGPTGPWSTATHEPPFRLRRLDPTTLAGKAEREFPGPRRVVLLPAAIAAP